MSHSGNMEPIHSYDGIQEYDNPLPGWWKWLFLGTFFFSLLYLMYFHTGAAEQRSVYTAYTNAYADNLRQQFSEIGELPSDGATLLKYSQDTKWLKVGEVVFKQHCISCHGADAGGLVGPNLCDPYWKNVKKIEDVAKIVEEGAANGAMPAWKTRLVNNERILVAAYVASLRGSNPSKAKAPEGNELPPWSEIAGSTAATAAPSATPAANTEASQPAPDKKG